MAVSRKFSPLLSPWWMGLAAAGVIVLAALTWGASPLLHHLAQTKGSEALGRPLTLGALEFKWWKLELHVSDVRVVSADGHSNQLTVADLVVDASAQSIWKGALVIDAITIVQPHVYLRHDARGQWDVDDLLKRFQPDPAAKPSDPLRFAVHNIVLHQGAVDFSDQVAGRAQSHSLRNLEVVLPFLSNRDTQREVSVQPHLAFEINGSRFDTDVQATPFAEAPKGEVQLKVQQLDVAPYLPYLPAGMPVRLRSAVLDGTLKLVFAQGASNTLALSGEAALKDVQMDNMAGGPLLKIASVRAELKDVRPLEQKAEVSTLTVDAPQFTVMRNADGSWALPGMEAQGSTAKGSTKSDTASWNLVLDTFKLKGGTVQLTDRSVAPAVQLALQDMQLSVKNLQWPMDKQAQWDAAAHLQSPSTPKLVAAQIALQGEGTLASGQAHAKLTDLALSLAAPYISPYLVPTVQGTLEGALDARWQGSAVQLKLPRVALRDAALLQTSGNTELPTKELPAFKLLEAKDVALDLDQRSAVLGSLALHRLKLRAVRDEDGQWMFSHWLSTQASASAPTQSSTAKPAAAPNKPWRLLLSDLLIDDTTLTYVDRVPDKTVFLELSALQLHSQNLQPDGKRPIPLQLSARVRAPRSDPGSLRFDGSLMWDPLVVHGALEALQIPAQALAPYGLHAQRLELLRADTSFKGKLRYAGLLTGPEVQLQGDAAIEELQLNSFNAEALPANRQRKADSASSADAGNPAAARDGIRSEELLQWKALSVPGIDLSLVPGQSMRLKVRDVSLSDFFARLIINPAGRLVLQEIVRPEDVGPPAPPTEPVAQIEVGPIKLVNGRVAFSDRFIQPNYSASLTELSGSLGAFRSQGLQGDAPMAPLALRGRAEGTASLEITGKVNPLAKPLALDIQGKVRDLELSPLSSYAIKYAGYGIERGKLSLDVQYHVAPDGRLEANNNLVLRQLVFGDAVEGAANRLPVKLAVALLADRNGVVDINLPLSGSLNDPTFRVWPLVWKIVGNVLSSAITAPFRLIGGLFNGGDAGADEMRTVPFEPGSVRLSASGQQNLEAVARALRDKPSLRLTVVGSASLEREGDAIRRERLRGQLLAEKRRAAASAGKDVTAVVDVLPEESPALLKEVYRRSDVRKPRNALGLTKELGDTDMEQLLLDQVVVTEDAVRELALNRSLVVRDYLTARELPSDRLFLGESKTKPAEPDWQPHAELELEHR